MTIQDSGERRKFTTGSQRDIQEGKGRYDLISPIALERLAQHYEGGAKKYLERNWELGQPLSVYWNSANRHWQKVLKGMDDEDHEAAAMWNICCYIHTKALIKSGYYPEELDDMPNYVDQTEWMARVLGTDMPEPEETKPENPNG